MNIIDFLTEDHEKLRRQLKKIHQCLSQSCLRDKIEGFIKSYRLHESVEGKILFPSLLEILIDYPDRRALIANYEQTHKDMWKLMDRMMKSLEFSSFEILQQLFFEFSASAEMHLGQEERTLFPMIREYVKEETLEDWGCRAEECRCSILKTQEQAAHGLAIGMTKKPDHILVPVDFSKTSVEALDFAALIAGHVGSEMVLFTVEEPPIYEVYPASPIAFPDPKETERRLRDLFREGMERWPKDPPFPYDQRLKVLARTGSVIDQILAAARETHADMIVMGTHGRRGIARAILGSVTEQVIRRAPCPVLAIRAGSSLSMTESEATKEEAAK